MDIILKQFKNRALIARVNEGKAYQYVIGSNPIVSFGHLIWDDGDYFDDLGVALKCFNNWAKAEEEAKN